MVVVIGGEDTDIKRDGTVSAAVGTGQRDGGGGRCILREKQHDGVCALTVQNGDPRGHIPMEESQSVGVGQGIVLYRPAAHRRRAADDVWQREGAVDGEVQHRGGIAVARALDRDGIRNHPCGKLA